MILNISEKKKKERKKERKKKKKKTPPPITTTTFRQQKINTRYRLYYDLIKQVKTNQVSKN